MNFDLDEVECCEECGVLFIPKAKKEISEEWYGTIIYFECPHCKQKYEKNKGDGYYKADVYKSKFEDDLEDKE